MPSNAHFARSLTSGALAGLVACTAVGNMQHSFCIVQVSTWALAAQASQQSAQQFPQQLQQHPSLLPATTASSALTHISVPSSF